MTRNKEHIIAAFIFLFFTLFITWPLLMNMNGFLLPPQYNNISHSDSLQHISKIGQAKELLAQGKNPIIVDNADVSQLYIFMGVFLNSVFGIDPVACHNTYFLLSLFLSGFFMYLFMRELSDDYLASLFAGFLYLTSQYLPYAYYWGHSNTPQIQWIPLVFLFLEKMLKSKQIVQDNS